MRRLLLATFALALLTAPGAARAGLYLPGEPPDLPLEDGQVKALPFDVFQIKLQDVIGISMSSGPPTPTRQHYLAKRDELTAKGVRRLTVTELVALSGYQIRLGQPNEAQEVLQAARRLDPRNFALESHLALLDFMSREPSAAMRQAAVAKMRFKGLPGMEPEQVAWSLKAEQALDVLMRSRAKEQREKGARFQPEAPDTLFPVQFVGESGKYEPGAIAATEKAKIPPDAIATVQQLMFWLPSESRLYWLLAELYNANGEIENAAAILDNCVDARRFQADQLREHRRAIKDEVSRRQEVAAARRAEEEARQKQSDWRNHPEVFWVIGGAVAVPLILLAWWQLRLVLKRMHGHCPTGH